MFVELLQLLPMLALLVGIIYTVFQIGNWFKRH